LVRRCRSGLGQSVVIDNWPGGDNLALQAVAAAPADGYRLLMVATPHAINVTLYEKGTITVTCHIAPVARRALGATATTRLRVLPPPPLKPWGLFCPPKKQTPGVRTIPVCSQRTNRHRTEAMNAFVVSRLIRATLSWPA
jgi:Tripartite tricarboxylate transporter family receptor